MRKRLLRLLSAACCVVMFTMAMGVSAMAVTVNPLGSSGGNPTANLINTQEWASSSVSKIHLDYYFDEILILPSSNSNIVLKEYLSQKGSQYQASISNSGGTVKVTQGERPSGVTYSSKIELYVPNNYNGTVQLDVADGSIAVRGVLTIDTMILNLDEGKIQVDKLTATNKFTTKSDYGVVYLTDCKGNVDVTVYDGSIIVANSNIGGSIKATDYTVMNIGLSGVYSNININNKEGTVRLALPTGDSFKIDAIVTDKYGTLSNTFSNTFTQSGNTLTGSWGSNPSKTVTVSTSDKMTIEKN